MKGADRLDWPRIEAQLGQEGHAVLPGALGEAQVAELVRLCGAHGAIGTSLAAAGLGRGERFALPATPLLAEMRRQFYRHLAPVANRWNAALDVAHSYPGTLQELPVGGERHSCLTLLRADDHEALHQYGELPQAFPLQLVALLSEPGKDFTGGEFVMTEQRPRMQSRPIVLPLRRGDVAVIAVARRPHKGSAGHYRVNLKHAVSRVRSGERIGLELLFDDAVLG